MDEDARLPVEGSLILVINFRRSVIIAVLWCLEVAKLPKFALFDPLRRNFQNSVPTRFIATPIDVLCSNLVKFGSWKIGKIVRCLHDKKTKFCSALQVTLLLRSSPKYTRASGRECTQRVPDFTSRLAELYPNA